MSENTVFANNLLRLMKMQNFTAKDIAEKVHISESTVNAWCKGEKKPYPALVKPLCTVLCVGEDVLFGKEDLAFNTAAEPIVNTSDVGKYVEADAKEKPAVTPETHETAKTGKATIATSDTADTQLTRRKPRSVKAAQATVSDKEAVLTAMRDTRRDVKSITKNMTVEEATKWLDTVVGSCVVDIGDYIRTLGSIAKAAIPSAFTETPVIDEKFNDLLEAAKGASDEGLAMATAILKKFRA